VKNTTTEHEQQYASLATRKVRARDFLTTGAELAIGDRIRISLYHSTRKFWFREFVTIEQLPHDEQPVTVETTDGPRLLRIRPDQVVELEGWDSFVPEGKICTKCREDLPLSMFHADRTARDGLYGQCRDCVSRAKRAAYLRDDEIQHRSFLWRRTHRERKYEVERLLREEPGIRERMLQEYWDSQRQESQSNNVGLA
jgi:hypothetical protein